MLSHWADMIWHPDADSHAFWFARNVWELLRTSEHWQAIQAHPIDATLWLIVAAKSYANFVALAFDDGPELGLDLYSLLFEEYGDDEAVTEAAMHRFFGYGIEEVESFGAPDPREPSPFYETWQDRLIEAEAETRAELVAFLRSRIGATELILNFYRDPFGWDARLKGESLPEQAPLEPALEVSLSELLEATKRLFYVFL